MALERIQAILASCATDSPLLPPTELYNEGWLLRLALDWFSGHPVADHPLSFHAKSRWFSEAWLPSAFLPRERGDPLGESWTHADGVIGHFAIGQTGKAALTLAEDAAQLVVLEAKLFSRLASGVTHARYYDQAARNVACMAEALRRASRPPGEVPHLGFYVLAPHSQIEEGLFAKVMERDSIAGKVRRRVEAYEGEKDDWYADWFQPTFRQMQIGTLSWEAVVATIGEHDPGAARAIGAFYQRCLELNR